jgi:hypothetical protein
VTIRVVCSSCGKVLKAPDQLAGRRAICPACKAQVAIPAPELEEAEFDLLAEAGEERGERLREIRAAMVRGRA